MAFGAGLLVHGVGGKTPNLYTYARATHTRAGGGGILSPVTPNRPLSVFYNSTPNEVVVCYKFLCNWKYFPARLYS